MTIGCDGACNAIPSADGNAGIGRPTGEICGPRGRGGDVRGGLEEGEECGFVALEHGAGKGATFATATAGIDGGAVFAATAAARGHGEL